MARLDIRYPNGMVETRELHKDRSLVIGTDSASDLRLDDDAILPRHCSIRWVDRRYHLDTDPKAHNVFVGVNPVTHLRLKPGAQFSINNIEFRIHYDPSELGEVQERVEVTAQPASVPLYRTPAFMGIIAALLLLAVLGVGLYFLVRARGADRLYQSAQQDLHDGLYDKAIAGFDAFLKSYADDERGPSAVYHRGMARVLEQTESSSPSWSAALTQAEAFVQEAGSTADFREHPTEIGDLFIKIARGLALSARERSDEQTLNQSIQALELQKHLPDGTQQDEIARVKSVQQEAKLAVTKGEVFQSALEAMDKAIADKRPMEVYRQRVPLIHQYAESTQEKRLIDRMSRAAKLETELVSFSALDVAGIPPKASPLPARTRYVRAANTELASAPPFLVQVEDTIAMLDSGTGAVRWRVPVGNPVAFRALEPSEGQKHVVAYRVATNQVLLIEASSGLIANELNLEKLRPRAGCEALRVGDHVMMVATKVESPETGLLAVMTIDGDRLSLTGQFNVPQAIVTSPAHDPVNNQLFVVGEQASLYVINLSDRTCRDVVTLGHEAGAIRFSPFIAGRFLFLVESRGPQDSVIRCFVLPTQPGGIREKPSLSVKGVIVSPPVFRLGRIFLSTDQGETLVIDLGAETDERPMTIAASYTAPEANQQGAGVLVVPDDGQVWMLGNSARKLKVQVGEKAMVPDGEVAFTGVATMESQLTDSRILAVSRAQGFPETFVSAIDPNARALAWTTVLGQWPLAMGQVDSSVVLAYPEETMRLEFSDLERDQIVPSRSADQNAPARSEHSHSLVLPPQTLLDFSGEQLRRFEPGASPVLLKLPGPLGGAPALCGNGVLIPTNRGFVHWIDPNTAGELSDPFIAPLVDGSPEPMAFAAPMDPSDPKKGLIVASSRALLKISLVDEPAPAWKLEKRVELEGGNIVRLIVHEGRIWCFCETECQIFDAATLEKLASLADIKVPEATAANVPVLSGSEILLAYETTLYHLGVKDGSPSILWKGALAAPPVSPPVVDSSQVWLLDAHGAATSLSLADGSVKQSLTFHRGMARGPWRAKDALVGLSPDGSLVRLPAP